MSSRGLQKLYKYTGLLSNLGWDLFSFGENENEKDTYQTYFILYMNISIKWLICAL